MPESPRPEMRCVKKLMLVAMPMYMCAPVAGPLSVRARGHGERFQGSGQVDYESDGGACGDKDRRPYGGFFHARARPETLGGAVAIGSPSVTPVTSCVSLSGVAFVGSTGVIGRITGDFSEKNAAKLRAVRKR
ncbi:MAG: hypothetical protein ACR2PS_11500 [Pseudomonadales bacterium]